MSCSILNRIVRRSIQVASVCMLALLPIVAGCSAPESKPPAEAPSEAELTPPSVSLGSPMDSKGSSQPAQPGSGSPSAAPGDKK